MMLKTALMGCAALLWAGSAQAATFIEYTVAAAYEGYAGDVFLPPPGDWRIYGVATMTMILDLDNPSNLGFQHSDNYQYVTINGDKLTASINKIDGRGIPSSYQATLNFAPGLLALGIPAVLHTGMVEFGSITFDERYHYSGAQGSGEIRIISSRILDNYAGEVGALAFGRTQVDNVPEPATWLMMIGGFGLIGLAMRRKTRVRVTYA